MPSVALFDDFNSPAQLHVKLEIIGLTLCVFIDLSLEYIVSTLFRDIEVFTSEEL